jgi:adenosine deaminase
LAVGVLSDLAMPPMLTVLALVAAQASPSVAPMRPADRAARYLESVRKDPVALRAFLRALPKGGNLHLHLSGAVYAESFIRWAAEDGACVDTGRMALLAEKEPCDAAQGRRAARDAHTDPAFHAALVDALSLRNNHPARTAPGYQFFDVFSRFTAVSSRRQGEMLAEVATRAASQNVLYVEVTSGWDVNVARQASRAVEWTDDLAALHARLLDAGLREAGKTAALDAAEARMREVLACGTRQAQAGCQVTIRYQAAAARASPPLEVFSMLVWSFEQSRADPRMVGINLLQPEDWHVPVRDYDLHMRMLDYLHRAYPRVNIALHAGELTLGQVPPEVLGTHIEGAIGAGHARRIGHGADIAYHPRPGQLMEEMKRKGVAVEVCLSSNDAILGLRSDRHPMRSYLAAGVPVTIATDDEGVSRSDLTNEYLRAVLEHGLGYRELKEISRNGLRYSFLSELEKKALLARLDALFAAFEATAGRGRP